MPVTPCAGSMGRACHGLCGRHFPRLSRGLLGSAGRAGRGLLNEINILLFIALRCITLYRVCMVKHYSYYRARFSWSVWQAYLAARQAALCQAGCVQPLIVGQTNNMGHIVWGPLAGPVGRLP